MLHRRHFLFAAALQSTAAEVASLGNSASLFYGEEWDKPFLYPLRTVSGLNLSRRYPVETVPGEETDHVWHRGLWYGHGIINGHDFWRELGRDKTARIVVDGQPRRQQDSVSVTCGLVTSAGRRIGTNAQSFRVSELGSFRHIDAQIQVLANAGEPLTFGDTDDGGFAFRLSDHFREDRGALLRNANGLQDTKNIWGHAARWVDYSTVIEGKPCGVAIFDHPSNLRHPSRWHARGYSLCAANPFASKSFSKNKGPDGSYTIPAGGTLSLRYRVLIHEGPCEPDRIEALYNSWAKR